MLSISQNLFICAYVSVGFFISQILHTLIFDKSKHEKIWTFIGTVEIKKAYRLSAINLLMLLFVSIIICFNFHLVLSLFLLALGLAVSQLLGRSLIKFFFEWSFCAILIISLIFNQHYLALDLNLLGTEKLKFLYDDISKLFDQSFNAFFFYVGVAGVNFAVDFLKSYFPGKEKDGVNKTDINSNLLSQYQMFRYGILFLYVAIGGLYFILYCEFELLIKVRDIYLFNISQ